MVELTGTLGAATGPFALTPGPAEPSILLLISPLERQTITANVSVLSHTAADKGGN